MYQLVYSSPFTVYVVGVYTLDECERICRERYGMTTVKFGQDDAGTLYTPFCADDGIVVLKLYEVRQ